ncbi:MAG: hypothetical protein JWM11_2323 [Planctomycetaceae bacterium]|nr:hypothetical protein [Planctomycetaceae bacterium]
METRQEPDALQLLKPAKLIQLISLSSSRIGESYPISMLRTGIITKRDLDLR